MSAGVRRGWREGNTLVKQSKLEPPGQSGHILVPCHRRRSGCGLLFPKKSPVTQSRRRHCQSHPSCSSSCFGFLSVSLSHFPFLYSVSHPHFFCFASLIHSLSIYTGLIRSHVTLLLIALLAIWTKSPSLSVPGLDYQLHLSLSLALSVHLEMVLRFCCEMCGWEKRSLFCAEKW